MITNRTARTATRLITVGVAISLGLAGCSSEDQVGDEPMFSEVEPTPAETTPEAEASETQVGQGEGLDEEAYSELDQDKLAKPGSHQPVNGDDPEDVLSRGLATAFAWQPETDSNPFDAFRRAQSAFNRNFLRTEETKLTTAVPMSSRDWTDWGDHEQHFIPTVSVLSDQHPKDTATDFSRQVKIDLATSDGTNGRKGRDVLSIIGISRVHHTDHGWRIDSFEIIDTQVTPRKDIDQ